MPDGISPFFMGVTLHFVRLDVDMELLEDRLGFLNDAQLKEFKDIPRIVDGKARGVWVSVSHVETLQKLLGNAITGVEEFDHKDLKKVAFSKGTESAYPIMLNLMREIAELLDYEKVYVCTRSFFDKLPSAKKTNTDFLYVILNSFPEDLQVTRATVDTLRFGITTVNVPINIKHTFNTPNRIPEEWKASHVTDDNGTLIALHKGNRIWIPFDIASGMVEGQFEKQWYPGLVSREIVSRALASQAAKVADPQTAEQRMDVLERCRADFVQHCQVDLDRQKRELEREMAEYHEDIKAAQDKIAQNLQNLTEKRRLYDSLSQDDSREKILNKEFDLIKERIPLVRSVSFINNGIVFETEVIQLETDTATKGANTFEPFDLGRYRIELRRGSSPKVTNLTRRLKYNFGGTSGTWDHPHIDNGWMCLGNISGEVTKLVNNDKWFGAVTYIIEALKTWNSHDGWAPVGLPKWRAAAENEQAEPTFTDDKKDRIKNWVSFRHRFPKGLKAKLGDQVTAECPNTCPMKGNHQACPVQGDHKREGKIKAFYEDHVAVTWETDDQRVACPAFTYDSVYLPGGFPIYDGTTDGSPNGQIVLPPPKLLGNLPRTIGSFTLVPDPIRMGWNCMNAQGVEAFITAHTFATVGVEGITELLNEMENDEGEVVVMPTIDPHTEETPTGLPDRRWGEDYMVPELDDLELVEKFEDGLEMELDF